MVMTIRLPEELHRRIRHESEKRGLTMNAYILNVLWKEAEDLTETEKRGEEG